MSLLSMPKRSDVDVAPRTALMNYAGITNSSFMHGGIVTLQFTVSLSTPTDWTSDELFIATLEQSARPSQDVDLGRQMIVTCGTVGSTKILNRGLKVTSDGRIWFVRTSSTPDVATVSVNGVSFPL